MVMVAHVKGLEIEEGVVHFTLSPMSVVRN